MTKPQMPQMTPEQWESLATAVDALSSALAAVRPLAEWEMDLLNAATPKPDPWPTAPLIVADWTSGGVEGGRGLLYRETDADQYWTIRENESVYPEHAGDALTNVVPVTVVPVAALPVLWSALEQWLNNANRIPPSEETHRLVGAVESLRGQIDALGVSND